MDRIEEEIVGPGYHPGYRAGKDDRLFVLVAQGSQQGKKVRTRGVGDKSKIDGVEKRQEGRRKTGDGGKGGEE